MGNTRLLHVVLLVCYSPKHALAPEFLGICDHGPDDFAGRSILV